MDYSVQSTGVQEGSNLTTELVINLLAETIRVWAEIDFTCVQLHICTPGTKSSIPWEWEWNKNTVRFLRMII